MAISSHQTGIGHDNSESVNLDKPTGYAHAEYAKSLSEFGTPRALVESGGWILERTISGCDYRDAIGCYPIFVCRNWPGLMADLDEIGEEIVSLGLVADPFGEWDDSYLRRCFNDLAIPFKEHFVVDLSRSPRDFIAKNHLRNSEKALRNVSVETCVAPLQYQDDWTKLYSTLIERHGITGIAAFSVESFARQLKVPGLVAFRAIHDGTTVGMLLWYAQDSRAYYHLGAYSALGYDLRASFALFDYSIEYFTRLGLEWLCLGAGAGTGTNAQSGLSRFKQGWSTGTRTAYFCGRIFDKEKYQEIVTARNVPATNYFPAYRLGEFR